MRQAIQIPTSPPIVEKISPENDRNDACHRLGTQPPSVEPTMAPSMMTRLDDMAASYNTPPEALA